MRVNLQLADGRTLGPFPSKRLGRVAACKLLGRQRLPRGARFVAANGAGPATLYQSPYTVRYQSAKGSAIAGIWQVVDAQGRVRGTRFTQREAEKAAKRLNK